MRIRFMTSLRVILVILAKNFRRASRRNRIQFARTGTQPILVAS